MKIKWTHHDIKCGALIRRGGTIEEYIISYTHKDGEIIIGIVALTDGTFITIGTGKKTKVANLQAAYKLNRGGYAPVMKLDCVAGSVGHNIHLEVEEATDGD